MGTHLPTTKVTRNYSFERMNILVFLLLWPLVGGLPQMKGCFMKNGFSCEKGIYAKIIEVGIGKRPKVKIKIYKDNFLTCKVNKPLAKRLRKKINDYVWLEGIETFDPENFKTIFFRIKKVCPPLSTNLEKMLKKLAELTNHFFDSIEDVDEYCRKIREGEI